jgi:hypothetical protein
LGGGAAWFVGGAWAWRVWIPVGAGSINFGCSPATSW